MAAPRKDNVKDKILDAALELFNEKTLGEISLAEIAAKAGISKGTLYYHYKSKTDILFDITDRYLETQWDDLIKWTENKEKDTSMHRLVKYVIERNTSSANIRVHLLYSAILGDETTRKKLLERYEQFSSIISEKIAERTDTVSANYLTWLILLASDGIIIQKALKSDKFNADEFIKSTDEYLKTLLSASK